MASKSTYDDWLESFCAEFRRECSDLEISADSPRVKEAPTLFPSCQLYVVGTRDPTFQFLLITRNDMRPDIDRFVNVDVPADEFINVLEAFKDRHEFQVPLTGTHLFVPPGKQNTLNVFLDRSFVSFLAKGWHTVVRSRPGVMSYVNIGTACRLYRFRGRVIDQSAPKLAGEWADQIRSILAPPAVPAVQPAFVAQSLTGLSAIGAYIFPAVQIGELPELSFRHRASGLVRNPFAPKVAIRGEFRRLPMCADRDGLVLLVTESRARALKHLNRLMAGLLFLGLPTLAVRDHELIEGTVDPDTLELRGSKASLGSLRNVELFSSPDSVTPITANKMGIADFEQALKTVDAITSNQGLSQNLVLFLEAYSHLADQEYTPAFLMAWSILERQLSARWKKHLLQSGVSRKRISKLTVAERWSVDYLIECLDLLDKQETKGRYEELMALKEYRNSIVHSGRPASRTEVERLLALASNWLESDCKEVVGTVTPIVFKSTLHVS